VLVSRVWRSVECGRVYLAADNDVYAEVPLWSASGPSLMMEAVRTSETSVDNNFTRQYIPEDNSEHQNCLFL
jgi:hypothetical protein